MDQRPPTDGDEALRIPLVEAFGDPTIAARVAIFSEDLPLDTLAFRDHVLGLEVELDEARNEIVRLKTVITTMENRRSSKAIRAVERFARAVYRRLLA